MSAPVFKATPLGERTEYVFSGDLTRKDWERMDALLIDAIMMGCTPTRFIGAEATRIVITHIGEAIA